MPKFFVIIYFVFISFALTLNAQLPEKLELTTVTTLPHDVNAYTQGLFFDGGYLYESTGLYGQSTLRKVDPNTGNVLAHVQIPQRFFAEGLALAGGQMFQLTWQEGYCFVFDKATLEKTGDFRFKGEGWGLTFDGKHLILSDGSNTLKFFDPKTFKVQHKITVTDPFTKKSLPVQNLNELEYIHGEIWANVWQSNRIARIDPHKGKVVGWIDMSAFVPEQYRRDHQDCVLNGIAFDAANDHVYITGKRWNVMYVLKIGKEKE
jgi:glutaminyl-peptide cyclotransferase